MKKTPQKKNNNNTSKKNEKKKKKKKPHEKRPQHIILFAVFLLCVLRARYDLLLDTKGLCIT